MNFRVKKIIMTKFIHMIHSFFTDITCITIWIDLSDFFNDFADLVSLSSNSNSDKRILQHKDLKFKNKKIMPKQSCQPYLSKFQKKGPQISKHITVEIYIWYTMA